MLGQYLIVFGTAILELWAAIPAGFAINVDPLSIVILSSLGAFSGSLLVMLLGTGLQKLILKGHRQAEGREMKLAKIWRKYGVVGLGLLAPLLTGAPIGIAIGLAFKAGKGRLLLFTAIGIVFWSTAITLAGYFGLETAKSLVGPRE